MKQLNKTLILSALALIIALPAQAKQNQGHAPKSHVQQSYRAPGQYKGLRQITERQDRQAWRIKHGARSGDLTRKEAGKLRKQQRRIDNLLDNFMDDGRLSKRERNIMRQKQDRASLRIKRLVHNDRYRQLDRYKYGMNKDWRDWEHRRLEVVRQLNSD